MPVKLDNCPLCGGKVDDNCTTNYAECWCTECGLMLKAWGKDAPQKLLARWNERKAVETTVKPMSGGFEKCACKAKIPEGCVYCPSCGKKIVRSE